MGRYALTRPYAAEPTFEGDSAFKRLNMKEDRASLQPGEYSNARNIRLVTSEGRSEIASKRQGTVMPIFANPVPSIFTGIKGSGIYSDPDGREMLLVADTTDKIYQVRDGIYPRAIAIPAGEHIDTNCQFVQDNDRVLCLRGKTRRPLIWDGSSSTGFVLAEKSGMGNTATSVIPNIESAEAFDDRLIFLLPNLPNSFGMSDNLDYTTWNSTVQTFAVPSGFSDSIVRLFPWTQRNLVVFKRRSVKVTNGFTTPSTDETTGIVTYPNQTIQRVNDDLGLAAARAVVARGGDIEFLSEPGGIYSLTQVIQDKIQTSPRPVSEPIEPIIKRINWRFISGAIARSLGNYNYWAVPLDRRRQNSAILVENVATGEWEGYDTWNGTISIHELHTMIILGQKRLVAVDHVANAIYVLYLGKQDQLSGGRYEVSSLFETRGYSALGSNLATQRDFKAVEVAIETWRPSIKITLIGKGLNDEHLLTPTPITKDRRKYYTFGTPDFDVSNINADFGAPNREDYSVEVPAPPAGFYMASGVNVEKKQESMIRLSLRKRNRFVVFRIECSQGECDIKGIKLESAGLTKQLRTAA